MGAYDKHDWVHVKKALELGSETRFLVKIYVNLLLKTRNFVSRLIGVTVYLCIRGLNFVNTFRDNAVFFGLDHLWCM